MALVEWTAGDVVDADDLNQNFSDVLETPPATAGESLSAKDLIYRSIENGKAYKAHGYKNANSYGSASVGTLRQLVKLSATHYLELTNSGATLTARAKAITAPNTTISSATVTTSWQTTRHTTTRPNATICRISDTKFVVFYIHTSSYSLRYRTGSFDGATVTMDTDAAFTGSPQGISALNSIPAGADNKVGFIYTDHAGDPGSSSAAQEQKLLYLTVDTNSITIETSSSFSIGGSGSFFSDISWTNIVYTAGFLYGQFCVNDTDGVRKIRYSVIDIQGDTSVDGLSVPTLQMPTGSGVSNAYSSQRPFLLPNSGKAYYAYEAYADNTDEVSTISIVEMDVSGGKILYQQVIAGDGGKVTGGALKGMATETAAFFIGFTDEQNSTKNLGIVIIDGKLYNMPRAFTTLFDGSPDFNISWGDWYANDRDTLVYYNGDNTTVYVDKLPTPVHGQAVSAVSADAETNIKEKYLTGLSGLTANKNYYLKDGYTSAGEVDTLGTVLVGRALTTTTIQKCKK